MVAVLYLDGNESLVVDAGQNMLFSLSTKKNPAPAGEEEGQMMPVTNES